MTVLTSSGEIACICHEHNPRCTCLPVVNAPSLAPVFAPSAGQLRFMRLHYLHLVVAWQWHWLDTMLRAATDRGIKATLWRDEIEELLREGLMEAGMGFTMYLTGKGRDLCA